MRVLSQALLTAQRAETVSPRVRVAVRNDPLGALNLQWERLYAGPETDGPHGLTLAGDGSLLRARVSAAAENRRLYRQRTTNPGNNSNFGQWVYHANQYNVTACAFCSNGTEVSLVWARSNGEINRSRSTDNGASWQAAEVAGYAPSGAVGQVAAAYRTNGDLFLFFTEGNNLYLIRRMGGAWQARLAWNKNSGVLGGVAVIYERDWQLLVSGRDSAGGYRLWSLVYGDGGEEPAGNWSDLKTVMAAPADAGYEFGPVFLGKPDIRRFFCNEKYSGTEAYNRPLGSYAVPETTWPANLWTEPKPFNLQNSGGLALAGSGGNAWLSCPNGVWRASLTVQNLDLSGDLLTLEVKLGADSGNARLELDNAGGKYAATGPGARSAWENGARLDVAPGCQTAEGAEYSPGWSFVVRGLEYRRGNGTAGMVLYAADGWEELQGWQARTPLRWNAGIEEASVKDILAWVLARAGLKLATRSQSAVVAGFFPDFTIQAGENGRRAVNKLLSMVPDRLFIEGGQAFLVHPLAADSAVYTYGETHAIRQSAYLSTAGETNRAQVEGWDPQNQRSLTVDAWAWPQLERHDERLVFETDRNLKTVGQARERGEMILRKAEVRSEYGEIRTPVNCGLQLLDGVEINEATAGLAGAKRRVTGLALWYRPAAGEYENRIVLGGM